MGGIKSRASRGYSVDLSRSFAFKNQIKEGKSEQDPLRKTDDRFLHSSPNLIRFSIINPNYDLSAIGGDDDDLTDSIEIDESLLDSNDDQEMTEEQFLKSLTSHFIKNRKDLSRIMTHFKW